MILCAILTYNRLELLKRCIDNVFQQNLRIDKLLVIDNGSTDGTSDYLKSSHIKHITLPKGGSAQGWDAAICYANKHKYEFIWLMDDDGFPHKDALKNLMNSFDESIDCLSSTVIDIDNHNDLVFPLPKVKNGLPVFFQFFKRVRKLSDFKNKYYNFVHFFNGSLFRTSAFRKIGGVNLEFYHHGVEIELYYRLIKNNSKIFTINDALHFHPNVSQRPITKMWVYFYLKNSIIIDLEFLDYKIFRVLSKIFMTLLRIYKRNGLLSLFSYLLGKNSKIFYSAIYNGINKKMINLGI